MEADKKWAETTDSPVVFIAVIEVVRVRSIRADGMLIDDYFDEQGSRLGHKEWDGAIKAGSSSEAPPPDGPEISRVA